MSELTYVSIVGTRYQLDTIQNDIIQRGNYLHGEQSTRGGFLPIFLGCNMPVLTLERWWTGSVNKNLAAPHNRNKMVNAFAATEWVAGSDGAVLSRSVTSCAGMTAYLVLLAQTEEGVSISSPECCIKGQEMKTRANPPYLCLAYWLWHGCFHSVSPKPSSSYAVAS